MLSQVTSNESSAYFVNGTHLTQPNPNTLSIKNPYDSNWAVQGSKAFIAHEPVIGFVVVPSDQIGQPAFSFVRWHWIDAAGIWAVKAPEQVFDNGPTYSGVTLVNLDWWTQYPPINEGGGFPPQNVFWPINYANMTPIYVQIFASESATLTSYLIGNVDIL